VSAVVRFLTAASVVWEGSGIETATPKGREARGFSKMALEGEVREI